MSKQRYKLWSAIVLICGWWLVFLLTPRSLLAQERSTPWIHEVAWGDTLSTIAQRYGVSVQSVVEANHLSDANHIYAGQRLVIPRSQAPPDSGPSTPEATHLVQPGETLFRIAISYGITVEQIMSANELASPERIYAGQVLIIPKPHAVYDGGVAVSEVLVGAGGVHTVQAGETLFSIAQGYGVSVEALAVANRLLNPSQIYAGQTLLIPGAAASAEVGYTAKQSSSTHIVRVGDTLFSIARQYGVSVWTLAQVNHISNPSLLYADQVLTIPAPDALSRPSGEVQGPVGKSIVVDLSEQRTYVYENGELLWVFVVSTGIPGADTWLGEFSIQNKIPTAYAATWDLQMPWWLGFYWAGSLQNGFHALPILSNGLRLWESLLGHPASYGCIILSDADAQTLYNWAEIGTPVSVVP